MKLVPLHTLFNPKYGVNLELINLTVCEKNEPDCIRFISRKEGSNGLAAHVKRIESLIPNPAHTLSVAASGSVLSVFYQDEEYYSGRDLYYLSPKREMSVEEMMFYAMCLKANKYKYNYGRAANRTLKDILVPEKMPSEFSEILLSSINRPSIAPISTDDFMLQVDKWASFELKDLFDIKKGKRLTKEDMEDGRTPFIGAIDSNNGYRDFIRQPPIHEGGTITVNYNGSVAESFYQPLPFWASDDINVLYPKFKMSVYTALFISTIIEREKYRFNFGRKWHKERMEVSAIKLPTKNGKPDFVYMEDFIKSLPFSSAISIEMKQLKEGQLNKKDIVKAVPLTDKEFVEKYESGSIDLGKMLRKTIKVKK